MKDFQDVTMSSLIAGYFLSKGTRIIEFNAITKYYNTKSDVEQGRSRYYSNYHGKIGKDGKMKPGGSGGRFRYFNQIVMPDGEIHSLNALLQSAEESNDPILINETLENIRNTVKLFVL